MKIFSRTIILCLVLVCACSRVAYAETLPGGLDDVENLYYAWEIQSTPQATKTRPPYSAYIGLSEKTTSGDIVPNSTPETGYKGLDALVIERKTGLYPGLYNMLSLEHGNTAQLHSWTIDLYSVDGEDCTLKVRCVFGALSDNEQLWLYQEDGVTLVQDLSAATADNAVSVTVAPGKYVVKYTAQIIFNLTVDGISEKVKYGATVSKTAVPESGYKFKNWVISGLSGVASTANPLEFKMPSNDVTLTACYEPIYDDVSIEGLTLQQGWNLIALPFTELTYAFSGEKDVLETEVYLAQNGKFTKATLKELVGGKAGWIYCEGTTELALTGKCPEGDASAFPEYSSGRWNFLGVVGKCDAHGKLIDPVKALPDGAMRWDETKKTFSDASGTPVWCMGYLIK